MPDLGVEKTPRVDVPLSALLTRHHAPSSAYALPDPSALATHIVEGKRELDRVTRNERGGVSKANCDAPPAVAVDKERYQIEHHGPLPLLRELSYRLVDGCHLWLGVQEGVAIVLSDDDQAIFSRLRTGKSPATVINEAVGAGDDSASGVIMNLIGRLAEAGFIRGVEGHTDSYKPVPRRFMRLHLTQRCNLACIHCYADSGPHVSSDGELPVERWLRLLDDFADVRGERVLFTGGEALVYAGCDALLRRASERQLHVTLFSNGILIERHLPVIAECVDEVQISIDGPDKDTHDAIRGKGSFDRAVRAVDLLVAAGVQTRVSIAVMRQSWQAIREGFVSFTRRWQGQPVKFRLGYGLIHHGRGADISDDLTASETRPIVERLMVEVEGEKGQHVARSTKGCGYAEQIVVAPDGSIHPCHLLDGALTHIDKQSVEVLVGLLERTASEYDVDHNVGCGTCDIRNLCGGTCRVQNGKSTGNRRVTNCTASDKMQRLQNLVETFRRTDA
jgi:radical SAM protein with 4Fe4S-binding SPASM domain